MPIAEIHEELNRIYNRGLALLGGSYLYGEASKGSDLDFYIICPWRAFFYYCRHKELVAELKVRYPRINIMLAPNYFFKKGWYYIYGQDLAGKIHVSSVNKRIIWRNCLKLACFSYLKFLLSVEPSLKQKNLLKARRLLATALSLNNFKNNSEPIFAAGNLSESMTKLGDNDLLSPLKRAWQSGKDNLTFSLVNYLIYNFRFLPKGDFSWLGRNPDKFILDKFFAGFDSNKNLSELAQEMQQIVFPVFVI